MVDITETDTALCLNNVSFDNVILNDTDTFIDNIDLVDVTYTNTRLCLSSVGFPSVILKDTGTPVSVSDGWRHPPDSGITLQCRLWCLTLVFDISSVIDTVSDRLSDTADPLNLTLKASNVVVWSYSILHGGAGLYQI
jgi:hypothetical protein